MPSNIKLKFLLHKVGSLWLNKNSKVFSEGQITILLNDFIHEHFAASSAQLKDAESLLTLCSHWEATERQATISFLWEGMNCSGDTPTDQQATKANDYDEVKVHSKLIG